MKYECFIHRQALSCKFNWLKIDKEFNDKMHKGTVDVKMFNNSFKSICHLIQKQLPDPGEGALGVDGAGVWKKYVTFKFNKMFTAALVVLYR